MVLVVSCTHAEIGDLGSSMGKNEQTPKPSDGVSSAREANARINDENQEPIGTSLTIENQDRYVSFPAVGVRLIRPRGFDDAESFHGFQQPSSQSSVMVMKIPGPSSEVMQGFTPERMKTRGMTLLSRESVVIDGNPGILLNVRQRSHGTLFEKWMVIFGNEREIKMAMATFPNSAGAKFSNRLKSTVLSTREEDSPPPAPEADIGFTIVASEKLKMATSIGKMLVYTKDGAIPAESPADPLFVVGLSISKVAIGDGRQFALQRLFQTAQTKIASVRSIDEITVDGLNGYDIVADGEDSDSGTPLTVYQVVLYEEGSYLLIQGLVGARSSDEYLPEFKSMARSFTREAR